MFGCRRFLRAREFDPAKAQKQFSDTVAFREQHEVDTLYRSFPPAEFEEAKACYPTWTGRRYAIFLYFHDSYFKTWMPPQGQGTNYVNSRRRRLITLRTGQHGLPIFVYKIANLAGETQKRMDIVSSERWHERLCAAFLRLCGVSHISAESCCMSIWPILSCP
jgi:hypothetical protein